MRVELRLLQVLGHGREGREHILAVTAWRVTGRADGRGGPQRTDRAPQTAFLPEILGRADEAARAAQDALLGAAETQPLCRTWAAVDASGGRLTCARDCRFRHSYADEAERHRTGAALKKRKLQSEKAISARDESEVHSSEAKGAKSARAGIFVAWLIETFGAVAMSAGGGVLDIAGGKGQIAFLLQVEHRITATLVDPLVRQSIHQDPCC